MNKKSAQTPAFFIFSIAYDRVAYYIGQDDPNAQRPAPQTAGLPVPGETYPVAWPLSGFPSLAKAL